MRLLCYLYVFQLSVVITVACLVCLFMVIRLTARESIEVTLIGPIMFVFGLVMLCQSLPPDMAQSSEFMFLSGHPRSIHPGHPLARRHAVLDHGGGLPLLAAGPRPRQRRQL